MTSWPELPTEDWHDTIATLHRWTQVIGKIRMHQSPWLNHSWSVALYVTPVGLTTNLVPYGSEGFRWELDLPGSGAELVTSTGERRRIELHDGLSVAQFHAAVLEAMESVDMPVSISTMPSEIADAVPFPEDHGHATYDVAHASALHRALLDAARVFERFRSGFTGKASPVHFFWGSFDLAVTRFSGRLAPKHPGGLPNFPADVAAEAYSHEVTSVGFWPGDRTVAPLFYAYAYPSPDGFADAAIDVEGATWSAELGEFVLPYAAVAAAADPDAALLSFCEQTHAAAADRAGWDRDHLECATPRGPDWWRDRPHPEPAPAAASDDGVVVTDDPDRHRYVITVDGVERGAAVYRRFDERWLFVHTEIDPAFDGRGLGSRLARAALDDVAARGGRVVPLCPFIAGWIERHPEYDALVDHEALGRYRR
jgi:predicted GNAT family acetyltransferase